MRDFVNKILGSEDQDQTLLEQKHNLETSDLFVQDRNGETKYNKEAVLDQDLKKNALNWANFDDRTQEELEYRFQDNIEIAGNRMEIDWNGTQEVYQEVVGQDEDIEYLSENQATQESAQSAYKATAALEGAVRKSLHGGMEQIIYETETEEGETLRTPVQPTVPEAMYAFTEKTEEDEMPEGWSIGHATAVVDRYHIKEQLKSELRHESGISVEGQIERIQNGEEIDNPLEEATSKDDYVQHQLEEYGFPEDEVDEEYAFSNLQ